MMRWLLCLLMLSYTHLALAQFDFPDQRDLGVLAPDWFTGRSFNNGRRQWNRGSRPSASMPRQRPWGSPELGSGRLPRFHIKRESPSSSVWQSFRGKDSQPYWPTQQPYWPTQLPAPPATFSMSPSVRIGSEVFGAAQPYRSNESPRGRYKRSLAEDQLRERPHILLSVQAPIDVLRRATLKSFLRQKQLRQTEQMQFLQSLGWLYKHLYHENWLHSDFSRFLIILRKMARSFLSTRYKFIYIYIYDHSYISDNYSRKLNARLLVTF